MMSLAGTMNALSIRQLTIDELPLCRAYGEAFHAEKCVPGLFSIDLFCQNWTVLITQFNGAIFGLWDEGNLVGAIGGMVAPDFTAVHPDTMTPLLTANELFLYIDPSYRRGDWWLQLVARFKDFGRSRGASRHRLSVTILPGDDVDRTTRALKWKYKKMGLRPVELGFDGPL